MVTCHKTFPVIWPVSAILTKRSVVPYNCKLPVSLAFVPEKSSPWFACSPIKAHEAMPDHPASKRQGVEHAGGPGKFEIQPGIVIAVSHL
jgi:hypothetical protein